MEEDFIVNKINEIYGLIREHKLDEAELNLDELIEGSSKTEIDRYGKILDFENNMQFVFYCNYKNVTDKLSWQRSYLSDMYYIKGYILDEKGEYEKAQKELKKSLKWNPVRVSTYMELMEQQIKLNNWDEFKKYFKEALKVALTPMEISMIYRKYAFFCTEKGEYELAYNILKYTALICYRKENEEEIEYLSHIHGVALEKAPNIGTVSYIREHGLEYFANTSILFAYTSMAEFYEEELVNEEKELTKEQRLVYLKSLIDVYTKLYFFKCTDEVHNLQIDAIRRYNEESKVE